MRTIGLSCLVLLLCSGCSDDTSTPSGNAGHGGSAGAAGSGGAGGTGGSAGASGAGGSAGGDPGNASFSVRESVEQLHVWGADPGLGLELRDAHDETVALATTDAHGSFVFRKVAPGDGYVIRTVGASAAQHTRALRVLTVEGSLPAQSFYSDQSLQPGYRYITTRDGTTLSAFVTLPGPVEDGPYPTIVNYSGYDPSKPHNNMLPPDLAALGLCDPGKFPVLCDGPADPSGLIGALLGYATVSVNMRGTGCSGGAYDFFETLQVLDGYDVIETVAAQPWVKGGKVGMTGLSYPGISQLFVARAHPPHLAAITPLSVIGNTATTMVPGGILNTGFALNWIDNVLGRAGYYGQGWEQGLVDAGDAICATNQLLHDQKVDNVQMAIDTPFYVPELLDPLNPSRFVQTIDVPVFHAGAWQDEQTGPFFTTLMNQFTSAPVYRATTYNGVHADGFSPQILVEWKTFLDLYVADVVPSVPANVRSFAPLLFEQIYGASIPFPPDRFASYATAAEARAAFEAEAPIRVLFENGAGAPLGAPVASWEHRFSQWPPAETVPTRWYFQNDGSLAPSAPAEGTGSASFLVDPFAGSRGILAQGSDINALLPNWDWQPPAAGSAAVFVTPPLASDVVMVGTGSVDLYLQSTATDADLEVTLSEVRPDGQERFVQAGWLRASHRKLDAARSTELWPEPTHLEADAAPLPKGTWEAVRVPIAGFAHAFRAGSRVRVMVDTPGDSRVEWRFDNLRFTEPTTHTLSVSSAHASSVVLPVIPGITVPAALPACPSLRDQPCRAYAPYVNTP